jgi:hypothetical protein
LQGKLKTRRGPGAGYYTVVVEVALTCQGKVLLVEKKAAVRSAMLFVLLLLS